MLPAWPVADLYSPAWTVVGSQLRSQVSWHAGVGQRRASHWLALLPTAASLASQIQPLAKQAWRILSLHHKSQQSRNSLSLAFLLHILKKKKKKQNISTSIKFKLFHWNHPESTWEMRPELLSQQQLLESVSTFYFCGFLSTNACADLLSPSNLANILPWFTTPMAALRA